MLFDIFIATLFSVHLLLTMVSNIERYIKIKTSIIGQKGLKALLK